MGAGDRSGTKHPVALVLAATPRTRRRSDVMAARPVPPAPPDTPLQQLGSGAEFWALLNRWGVSDVHAEKIIGQPPGTRLARSLTKDQSERLEMLREIDRLAAELTGVTRRDGCGGPIAPRSSKADLLSGKCTTRAGRA